MSGTYLDPEERAYAWHDKYVKEDGEQTAKALMKSPRKFTAVLSTSGTTVSGRCGIPDTAFTIPAVMEGGRLGYLSSDDGTLVFNPYKDNPKVRDIGNHVHSYLTADKFLGVATERKLANNTVIMQMPQSCYYGNCAIGVKLHRTIIVKYYQSGHIELNSGGYHTVTTKQRINQLLPPGWRLSQHKYDWTVTTSAGTFEFEDGMLFDVNGNPERKTHMASNPPRQLRYADIGVVSEGTLKTDDLIDAYSEVILEVRGIRALSKLQREAKDNDYSEDDVLEMLTEAMDELAPPYAYFGAAEGDGALFGFWPSMDSIQEDIRNGEILGVDDTSDIPPGFSGFVVNINDHGNVTLYEAKRGKLREVWAVV